MWHWVSHLTSLRFITSYMGKIKPWGLDQICFLNCTFSSYIWSFVVKGMSIWNISLDTPFYKWSWAYNLTFLGFGFFVYQMRSFCGALHENIQKTLNRPSPSFFFLLLFSHLPFYLCLHLLLLFLLLLLSLLLFQHHYHHCHHLTMRSNWIMSLKVLCHL